MPNDSKAAGVSAPDLATVGAFLHALAARAERDRAFGRAVRELLVESGLLTQMPAAPSARQAQAGKERQAVTSLAGAPHPPPDPFALLRQVGEDGLRERLAALDVPALRQIVRAHYLDPARISARWTVRERLVELIMTQVRARGDHGKAFARV
jgi:hypothetical protein